MAAAAATAAATKGIGASNSAAAIQGASMVGSGLFGSIIAAARAKKNAAIQFKNWKKAFDYEAEYNTPVNQLQRLYDAGINPLYNSDFSQGNTISGGMSTGSLPEGLSTPVNFSSIGDAYLRGKEVENQTRHVENEAVSVGNDTIRTTAQYYESLAKIQNLQANTKKTDKEVEELDQQIAASKAYVQMKQRELNLEFYNAMIKSREVDVHSRSVSNQKELGVYANATDRWQASISNARLNFEKDLYKEGGYYENQQKISRQLAENDKTKVENERIKLEQEFAKWNDERFFKYLEQYLAGFSYRGFGFGKWNKQAARESAMKDMALSQIAAQRIASMNPHDPTYVYANNMYDKVQQRCQDYMQNLVEGTRVGTSDYYQGKDGNIDFVSPALQNIRTSGSLYNPTQ